MKTSKSLFLTFLLLCLSLLLTSCQSSWQTEVITPDGQSVKIDSDIVKFYVDEIDDDGDADDSMVSISYILFHYGFSLIDTISFIDEEQTSHSFDWEVIAENTFFTTDGNIQVEDEIFTPTSIEIMPSPLLEKIEISILDIAPTVLSVLDLPPFENSAGVSQTKTKSDRAVMIFVDGLQYEKLLSLIDQNKLPFFQSVEKIHKGITVYPSITTSSTAALLTGLPPKDNDVYGYGYRFTDQKTIFDIASENGLVSIAVEGHSLAFNIRNAEVILSGDRDGDGYTNDNVLANSLDVIHYHMPDLLFIHFHDVDDMGHAHGPNSIEYEKSIQEVDGYIMQIIESLPQNTFITIFADHGMQAEKDGSGGNHGLLTSESMIIPIIFLSK